MKKVLFLCTGNSCRSQMAEGFLRQQGGGGVASYSAGTLPKEKTHPLAVKAMREKGIDISAQKPKSLKPFVDETWDAVITVCDNAKETCPVFNQADKTIAWSFEDPADATGSEEEQLIVFRKIRDQIEKKINTLVKNLCPGSR